MLESSQGAHSMLNAQLACYTPKQACLGLRWLEQHCLHKDRLILRHLLPANMAMHVCINMYIHLDQLQ